MLRFDIGVAPQRAPLELYRPSQSSHEPRPQRGGNQQLTHPQNKYRYNIGLYVTSCASFSFSMIPKLARLQNWLQCGKSAFVCLKQCCKGR